MRRLVFALLSTFSLAACAQTTPPPVDGGQKISVDSTAPATAKPAADPAYAAGSAEARVSEVLKTIPLADRIVYSPVGAAKYKVVVLTDVECGYCRKFHNEMAEYTKRGIEVQYLAFPRAGVGSPDYRKMVSVWCADDRRKALTDAKNDRPVPAKTCKTPVDMQHAAGLRMGLEGTPMILTTDGEFLGGYLPPDALLQRMRQIEAERTQPGKPATGA